MTRPERVITAPNRRTFIRRALSLAGASIALPGLSLFEGGADDGALETVMCGPGNGPRRSAGAAEAAAAGGLRYEGTHILTHGALRDIAREYRGPLPFVVNGGGCDDGITSVRRREADLGGMCCPVEGSRGEGLKAVVVARDIKVAVVHPTNPVRDLSRAALADVGGGRATRWTQLGGDDRMIALVVRDHCPEYREPARILLLGEGTWSRSAIFVRTDKEIVDTVARFPGALGIVSWVFAQPLVASGELGLVSLDGVQPTADAVIAGQYPLHGPLSLVFSTWRDDMRPLFDFIFSDAGRAIVQRRLIPVDRAQSGYGFG
ncbi:MAG: substrate-binding domain-containing protein [Hyphomicrobiaceae bacterium]